MDLASASLTARAPSRAAQYVRMSTEHQQYSPENQLEIIRQYAATHNMEIVREYSDHGRSGLNLAGREGLNRLMADVDAKRKSYSWPDRYSMALSWEEGRRLVAQGWGMDFHSESLWTYMLHAASGVSSMAAKNTELGWLQCFCIIRLLD